ncbi:MAG: ABC transporter ATP-binding protein [Clostridiales bacterium]|jgi:iron complex transport system ATP-binding protein|nr:ABC transporter ATP-binding protein [Clostridiales bacterium]
MIELTDVSGGYRGKKRVFDVTVEFTRGSVTCVLGTNGSGKSTLIKLSCGLLPLISGIVSVDGVKLSAMSRKAIAQKIAYLPQERDIPDITAEKLVMHGRFPHLGYPRIYSEREKAITCEAMKTAGILHLRSEYLSDMSGGERQKTYMAMMIAQDTDAVFLDEPTTYLDIARQIDIADIVKTLRQTNKAVIMASHDINLALSGADKIILMKEGRILAATSPDLALESGALEETFGVKALSLTDETGHTHYVFARK